MLKDSPISAIIDGEEIARIDLEKKTVTIIHPEYNAIQDGKKILRRK